MPTDFNEISQWIQVLDSHNLLHAVQARPQIWKKLNQALVDEDLESLQEALEKADFYGLLTDVWNSDFGDEFQGAIRLAGDKLAYSGRRLHLVAGLNCTDLRRKLIRLAHRKPELRPHLLPLLIK